MKHTYNGILISIEGIDGSGKSTLATTMYQHFHARGHQSILTKEPGATALGKEMRHILHTQKATTCDLAEYLLFAADRAQHFQELVIPALKQGAIIIADRLADSSIAYQGYGRGLDIDMIKCVNAWAMQSVTPDLTFYVRINPTTALQRVLKRNEALTSFEQEKMSFWNRVCKGYDEIFASKDAATVVILDGNHSPAALAEKAIQEIENRYQL